MDIAWDALTPDMRDKATLAEVAYVMTHSSSRHYIDLALAGEMVAGKRGRMSFAPMVIMAGTLMGGEAVNAILDRPRGVDCRGWFLNPHSGRVEKPRPWLMEVILRPIVQYHLKKLTGP